MKKIIALWIVAGFAGCDSDQVSSERSDVIMPLAVGNEWCYTTEWYTHGELDKAVNGCEKLTNVEQIDSLTCYYDGYQTTMGTWQHYYTNRSDGLWLVSCGGIIGGCRKQLSIPYPATLGTMLEPDTAIYTEVDSSNGGWRAYEDTVITALTLVSLDTLIEVPAGSFYCYKYAEVQLNASKANGGMGRFYCYAVNKGLIYQEVSYIDQVVKKFAFRSYLTSLKLM